jgi:hypothetical protein
VELCEQTGTAQTFAPCRFSRTGAVSDQCVASDTCVHFPGDDRFACLPLCDTGGTLTCPYTGSSCDPGFTDSTVGYCLNDCSSVASSCPAGSSCDTNDGYCL